MLVQSNNVIYGTILGVMITLFHYFDTICILVYCLQSHKYMFANCELAVLFFLQNESDSLL